MTFAEFIDNRDLAPDEFPHAAQGPAWLSRARKSLILAVAGTAFLAALHWGYIHAGRYVAIEGARADLTSTREILLTALWKIRQALGLVEAYRPAATALLWIYCAAMCAIYTGLLIARQRCFERDVVANDREALAMKKAILKRRKVTQKIAALEEKSKATTSRGTDLESKLDALFSPRGKEHESEIKGLKAFANLKVNIN
ncbi:hypothetical protein, partial [Corynebacterium mastitidis]|uniref:hypothetical protein n=1 Tax=Corynebacterium mastitidis TaxID=161890 RepID=UPI0012E9B63F